MEKVSAGNSSTRRAKIDKSIVEAEKKKCEKNPVYFIKNYCKITHPDKGLINFKLRDYQEDLIEQLVVNKYNIILKSL